METKQAIVFFTQSEKIKSALIWCSQAVLIIEHISPQEQAGALRLLRSMTAFIATESHLARRLSGDQIWLSVDQHVNKARVMIDSGVWEQAPHHFTQALTQVNRIGQRAMTVLLEKGLL